VEGGDAGPGFDLTIQPELEAGVYANFVATWHTAFDFTFDFGVVVPDIADPDHSPLKPVRGRIVARVKIPVTIVFDVIRALNDEMTRYEATFGEIRRPGELGEP